MQKLSTCILLFAFYLGYACCEPSYPRGSTSGSAAPHQNTLFSELDEDALRNAIDSDISNYDKRVERYAFGLGRRAYTYTTGGNGVKRLPVYNFGLGKRAKPYSFGLGKRTDYDDDAYENELERSRYFIPEYAEDKRHRPSLYNFGLGKRSADMYQKKYDFGMGKRSADKDQERYGIGLGKRSADMDQERFGFGLGKRSADMDEQRDGISLRRR